jgi:hypothetical protein
MKRQLQLGGFNKWMEEHRYQELRPKSPIILDTTRFGFKKEVKRIANYNGHKVIFLLSYNRESLCFPDKEPMFGR